MIGEGVETELLNALLDTASPGSREAERRQELDSEEKDGRE
jgi:hypothetical protein